MNRKIFILSIAIITLGTACAKNNQPVKTSDTTVAAANTTTETASSSPAETIVTEDGFSASESGTEKAKPAAGKANVQGKVLFDGQPVANNEVKLCETFNQFGSGCGGTILTTKTDASGEYLFTNVQPRVYEALTVRAFNTKSYIFPTSGFGISATKYKLEPDKTFFVAETNLFKDDLKIQSPKTGSKIGAADLEVKWDAYPNASYYEVSITAEGGAGDYVNEKVDVNSFKPEKPLAAGKYNLKVSAYNADKNKLADSGYDYVEFTITGGAATGGDGNK